MRLTFLLYLLLFCFWLPISAQPQKKNKSSSKIEVINPVAPEPGAIATNVVFVVDASSTMYSDPVVYERFKLAWKTVVNKFAGDQLYFRVYIFSDPLGEKCSKKWVDAGGPWGLKEFNKALKWIMKNQGIYSYASKALKLALREKNPLDKNPSSSSRLTVVIVSDGGFSEAADGNGDKKATERILKGKYAKAGTFKVFDKIIEQGQAWRKKNGLAEASIVTVGIQNDDPSWGTHVKRSDSECQAWLQKIGKLYGGGYFYVRDKPKKKRATK